MKINRIIFAVLLIGSQQSLAQMLESTPMSIEALAVNTSFNSNGVFLTEPAIIQDKLVSADRKETTGRQVILPATIEAVAQGLQFKLDQRMEMEF